MATRKGDRSAGGLPAQPPRHGGGAAAAGDGGDLRPSRAGPASLDQRIDRARPSSYAFPGRAPGRHRHAGPGPAALRGLRRHDRRPRRAGRAAPAWTRGRRADDRRRAGGPSARWRAPSNLPPDDTGEAIGLPPSAAHDHLRLRADRCSATPTAGPVRPGRSAPAALRSCRTSRRQPRPGRSDGDLCVQACADDPQVAVHAIRNLARIAFGTAAVRWSQLGFGRTSSTSTDPDHAAQPVRVQGRHGEHQGRGGRGRSTSTSGSPPATTRRRLADRRLLPGGPPDQHDHRDLGPAAARRAGGRSSAGPRTTALRCRAATEFTDPTSTSGQRRRCR